MDARHKATITRNLKTLSDQLTVDDMFLNVLEQEGIITKYFRQSIEAINEKKQIGRATYFLSNIKMKGPKAMNGFINALIETEQDHLAEILDEDLAKYWIKKLRPEPEPALAPAPAPFPRHPEAGIPFPAHHEKEKNDPGQPAANVEKEEDYDDKEEMISINIQPVDQTDGKIQSLIKNTKDVYKMTSNPRGRAIIVNNEKFTQHKERTGTNYDCCNLQTLFESLLFTVDIWCDCTADTLRTKIKEETEHKDHETSDCFVFIILTHGRNGQVCGTDGARLDIMKDIVAPFRPHNCKSLLGKPKLFFIQACQGIGEVQKVHKDGEGDTEEITENMFKFTIAEKIDNSERLEADPDADIIIAVSTVPGRISYREEDKGTWFMRSIVHVFNRYAHEEDILHMLTKVNNLTNSHCTSVGHVQMPEPRFRLTRLLYFFPGLQIEQKTHSS